MRPYLAVIYDSFHSALSSRVLWIAFVAIWILLGALAPLSYREDYTIKFSRFDFDDGTRMKKMLARGLDLPAEKKTALGRLARAMPEDLKRDLRRVTKGEVRIRISVLADALNSAIEDESWYDAKAWKATARLRELRELDATADADLSDELRQRRARLRIEAALPGVFAARRSRSILLTYAGIDFPAHLPVSKPQFDTMVNQFVLPVLMNWLLGFVLIFLGILVTASIVPDMLQPGSLHLLLSKPVSRSLLLISKFVGGCAFVFLCVCQLVIGLWLIAGLRLDLWNVRLLWCIPVAVFLFSVFYSVSMLAGLRWRSPILAIGVTCIFGAIVLVVGAIGGYFDSFIRMPDTIRSIVLAGDDLIATTRGGGLNRFDAETQKWESLMERDPRSSDLVVPVTKMGERIVTARVRGGRFNPYGSGSLDLLVLGRKDNWDPEPGLRLPTATRRLFVANDSILAMNTGGLMQRSVGDVLESIGVETEMRLNDAAGNKEGEKTDSEKTDSEKDDSKSDRWLSVLPSGVTLAQPVRLVMGDEGDWLILYSLGRLFRLEKSEDAWEVTQQVDLEGEAASATVAALSGSRLFLARTDEPPMILDANTFQKIAAWEISSVVSVYSAVGIKDANRFAVTMSDGSCQIVGLSGDEIEVNQLRSADVDTVAFDADSNSLIVAHHVDQVDVLDLETLKPRRRIRPSLESWRFVDHYVISPLRVVTPQTGELGDTVAALVGGKNSLAVGQNRSDDGDVIRYKILRPVLSCAGFVCVMLLLCCAYFARTDF